MGDESPYASSYMEQLKLVERMHMKQTHYLSHIIQRIDKMMKIRRLKIIAEFPDYVQVFSTAVQFPIT
jgi:hypothetical protein